MDVYKESIDLHAKLKGKLEIISKQTLTTKQDLSLLYTPGVAEPCREIAKDKLKVFDYTMKSNTVAVISDGSAVLGLGNIGPEAGLPVMEGKCVLFKEFGKVNAFPICLATQDTEAIIRTVEYLAPVLGGINLEDISAPRCFEIEERLKASLDIPVFHDDQHGTAIVTLAGLFNALKIIGKKLQQLKVVINGAGSAGIAIAKIFLNVGIKNIILCDTKGIVSLSRSDLNPVKQEMAGITNPECCKGSLKDALKGSDVFIGVSVPGVLNKELIQTMAKDAIIFAMANPIPEIFPIDDAYQAGAKLVATGRSDLPNQINNVLAFPGIFRGALDVRAKTINEEMKLAAAYAIAAMVSEAELAQGMIVPSPLNREVALQVGIAAALAAIKTGVAAFSFSENEVKSRLSSHF